jgi:hypothetical protein
MPTDFEDVRLSPWSGGGRPRIRMTRLALFETCREILKMSAYEGRPSALSGAFAYIHLLAIFSRKKCERNVAY